MTIPDQLTQAIRSSISDAEVRVEVGSPGHYALHVRSSAFRGKSMIDSHRLVLAAISALMAGDSAPVHAIDRLKTEAT